MKKLLLVLLLCSVCKADRVALLVNGGGGKGMDTNTFASSDEIGQWYRQLLGSGYSKENIWVMDAGGDTNDISYFVSPIEKPEFGGPFSTDSRDFDSIFWLKTYSASFEGEVWRTWIRSPNDFDGDGVGDVQYDATRESWDRMTADMSGGSPGDELLVVLLSYGHRLSAAPVDEFTFGIWDWFEVSPGDLISSDKDELLSGDELAGYINRIPYARRNIIVEASKASAAWEHFDSPNTVLMASTQAVSWIGEPVLDLSTLVSPYELSPGYGMGYSMVEGLEGAADINDDGRITWQEAWDWSYADNPFSPDAADPVWRWISEEGSMGWATEFPVMFDPSGLAADWVAVQFTPGDVDLDGYIDINDFSTFKLYFSQIAGWSGGDFDGNGLVDIDDFSMLKMNYGTVMVVPEPSMLLVFGLFLWRVKSSYRTAHTSR